MAIFVPHPSTVIVQRDTGSGNMGDVTDEQDTVKFGLDVPFVLVLCRFWVAGGSLPAGVGPPDIELKQELTRCEEPSELFNQVVRIFPRVATAINPFVDYRVQADENAAWSWLGGTRLVPEWTNPDPGNMIWTTEFRFAPYPLEA